MLRPTTILDSSRLNDRLGTDVVLISEVNQHTGSFKFRAALSVASNVYHPHVITASSGNFGAGIALACKLKNKKCTVVMPDTSTATKIEAVKDYGAEVDLIDTTLISRAERVHELARSYPEAYIASAYDDPWVIEGNSSLGEEIATRLQPLPDAVVVPVGGGGLSSGVITGLRRLNVTVPVYGAEPLIANDAARSLRAGKIVRNEFEPQTVADGARTVSLGKLNWAILQAGLAGIVEVPEETIVLAMRLLFDLANIKAEPTGALGIGAILADSGRFSGMRVACVISGGNIGTEEFVRVAGGSGSNRGERGLSSSSPG